MRPLKLGLVALAAVAALTGCTADVSTRLDVRSATDAGLTATVTLTGEAADTVAKNTKLRDQLAGVFASRLHVTPDVSTGDHKVTMTAKMDYSTLTGNGDVLGVSAAQLSGSSKAVTLRLTLSDPAALRDAITRGTAGMSDAASVADTMIASTTVTTDVHFAGGVSSATTSVTSWHPTVKGGDAVLVRHLANAGSGDLTVTGDPTASHLLWTLGIGAVVVVAALLWAPHIGLLRSRRGRR